MKGGQPDFDSFPCIKYASTYVFPNFPHKSVESVIDSHPCFCRGLDERNPVVSKYKCVIQKEIITV